MKNKIFSLVLLFVLLLFIGTTFFAFKNDKTINVSKNEFVKNKYISVVLKIK